MNRILDSIRRNGVSKTFKIGLAILFNEYLYKMFPDYPIDMNGVLVHGSDYESGKFPWETTGVPNYESGLVSGIMKHINGGDFVVIVGGGLGVTATKAARQVGKSGEVQVYEGSSKHIDIIKKTLCINGVSDSVDVNHSIVGEEIHVHGNSGNANHLSPKDLPDCDILELDCEGSEISILENMQIHPEVVLVESHGVYGSPTSEVVQTLTGQGYAIDHIEIAEKRHSELHRKEDVYVITAISNT